MLDQPFLILHAVAVERPVARMISPTVNVASFGITSRRNAASS